MSVATGRMWVSVAARGASGRRCDGTAPSPAATPESARERAPERATPAAKSGGRLIEVPDSPVKASVWEEPGVAGEPVTMYSVSLDGVHFTEPRETDHRIMLRSGPFDPLDKVPDAPATLKAPPASDVRLVQFHTPALEAYLQDIERLGGEVWKFVPYNTFIVRIGEAGRKTLEERAYVRWMGRWTPCTRWTSRA